MTDALGGTRPPRGPATSDNTRNHHAEGHRPKQQIRHYHCNNHFFRHPGLLRRSAGCVTGDVYLHEECLTVRLPSKTSNQRFCICLCGLRPGGSGRSREEKCGKFQHRCCKSRHIRDWRLNHRPGGGVGENGRRMPKSTCQQSTSVPGLPALSTRPLAVAGASSSSARCRTASDDVTRFRPPRLEA